MDSFDINLDRLLGAPTFSQEPGITGTESTLAGNELFGEPSRLNQQLIPYSHPSQSTEIDNATLEAMMGTDWDHQEPFYGISQQPPTVIDPTGFDGTTEYFRISNTFSVDSYSWLPSAPSDQFYFPPAGDPTIVRSSGVSPNDLNSSPPIEFPTTASFVMSSTGVEPQDRPGAPRILAQADWSPFTGVQPTEAQQSTSQQQRQAGTK